jgi:hypothetical protein
MGVLSGFQAEPMTVVAWRGEAPPPPTRASRRTCGEAPASVELARMNAAKAIPANFTSRFNLSADEELIRYIKRTSFRKGASMAFRKKTSMPGSSPLS